MEEKDYQDLCKEVKEQDKEADIDNEMKEEYNNLLRIVKEQLEEIITLKENNRKQAESLQRCN